MSKDSFLKRHREEYTGEHKLGDAGQLFFFLLFISVWIADSFFLEFSTFLNSYVPWYFQVPAAAVLLVLSGYMAKTGLNIVFGRERAKSRVIREGLFGIIRHPIYLSEIILYLGFLVLSISLAATLVWIFAIGFLHYISRHEEKLLLDKFGDEYRKYMEEVPMWIPGIKFGGNGDK